MDEEGVQNKAWHYIFEVVGARGVVEPELAHPKWNGFKRALRSAKLEFSALKLTICCNFNHGAFLSGDKLADKREYMAEYLSTQDAEYYAEKSELIAFDRGEEACPEMVPVMLADMMSSKSMTNRMPFVVVLVLS
jgi:hypothetical protein